MPLTRITHENVSNNTIRIEDLSASAVNSLMYTANTTANTAATTGKSIAMAIVFGG